MPRLLALLLLLAAPGCERLRAALQPKHPPVRLRVTVDHSAATVENERELAVPIERALAGLVGVKRVESRSDAAGVQVDLVLEPRSAPFDAYREVQERLAGLELQSPPYVERLDLGAPELGYSLRSPQRSRSELAALNDSLLRDALARIPGVREVRACAPEELVEIRLDPARMAASGATAEEVENALAEPGLRVHRGANAAEQAPSGLASLLVHGQLRLADLAQVVRTSLPRCVASEQRQPVVSVRVKLDAAAPEAGAQVRARLAELQKQLPADVTLALDPAVRLPEIELAGGASSLERLAHQLSAATELRVDSEAPGSFGQMVARTQPDDAKLRTALRDLPEVSVRAVRGEGFRTVRADVCGEDLERLRAIASRVAEVLGAGRPLFPAAVDDDLQPALDIQLDSARAARLGLTDGDVVRALALARDGTEVAGIREGNRNIRTRVRFGAPPQRLEDLTALVLPTQPPVPLGAVAQLNLSNQPRQVRRVNARRCVGAVASIRAAAAQAWLSDRRRAIAASINLPPGTALELSFEGE